MTITICRERKNFWDRYEYVQEEKAGADVNDLKKALRAMKKDRGMAIHIDASYVIAWDSWSEYENGIVLLRCYERANAYTDKKCAWETMKKDIMKAYS